MAVRWLPMALLPVLAGQVQAGAWERAPGTTFLSLGYSLPLDRAADAGTGSLYLEHGLGRRLTAGMKLDQRQVAPHEIAFFLRRNVNPPDAALQLALEIGLSYRIDGRFEDLWRQIRGEPVAESPPDDPCADEVEILPGFERVLPPDLNPGLCLLPEEEDDDLVTVETGRVLAAVHLGRGFGVSGGVAGLEPEGGWWDLRLGVGLPQDDSGARLEVDATLGLSFGPRGFATLEVWHDQDRDGSLTSVVPGLGLRFGERYAATLRYAHGLSPDLPGSVEIGAWIEF